jgi:hypothetical protein
LLLKGRALLGVLTCLSLQLSAHGSLVNGLLR